MSSEVIQFPQNKIVREVPTEQVMQIHEKTKQRHVEAITDEVSAILHAALSDYGIDTEPEEFLKDFAMCMESIKSLVQRQFGIHNKLQPFVDNNIILDRKTGEVKVESELPCDVEVS